MRMWQSETCRGGYDGTAPVPGWLLVSVHSWVHLKLCALCRPSLPLQLRNMVPTVISGDEWEGRLSLFCSSLNRKFPLSLTMYSLYQSDRVQGSHTPLPSPVPHLSTSTGSRTRRELQRGTSNVSTRIWAMWLVPSRTDAAEWRGLIWPKRSV